jgi:hypothetical protein
MAKTKMGGHKGGKTKIKGDYSRKPMGKHSSGKSASVKSF